jgi:hypothetical protein
MHFIGLGRHLGYSGCDFIERDEDTLGATSNQVKSWVQVIKKNYFPRWSIWTFRSYNHSQRLLIWLQGQGQLIWSVIGHIADSPLHRSCQDDRNAYVERPVRSPDEGVMVLARTSPASDRSDRWSPTVWPVPAVKSEGPFDTALWEERSGRSCNFSLRQLRMTPTQNSSPSLISSYKSAPASQAFGRASTKTVPGAVSGVLPNTAWVRSCISTRDLYRFRLLLGQDLPTLYLWRVTANWGEHNRIYQYLLLFISHHHFSTSMLLVSWSPLLEMAS